METGWNCPLGIGKKRIGCERQKEWKGRREKRKRIEFVACGIRERDRIIAAFHHFKFPISNEISLPSFVSTCVSSMDKRCLFLTMESPRNHR